jgi:hypothetical protein
MSNATELLKEIYADLEYDSKLPLWLRDKVCAFLATELVEFNITPPGKELLRYHHDEDCIEIKFDLPLHLAGTKFYPLQTTQLTDEQLRNEVKRVVEAYVDEIDERCENNINITFSDLLRRKIENE